jgi:hypothetical protein
MEAAVTMHQLLYRVDSDPVKLGTLVLEMHQPTNFRDAHRAELLFHW